MAMVSTQPLTAMSTPWSRVLLEKLTCFQLVKKFPAFYGTRKFITAFTSACHLFLSLARSIQSIPPHPTSWIFILILSSHLSLSHPTLYLTRTIIFFRSPVHWPSQTQLRLHKLSPTVYLNSFIHYWKVSFSVFWFPYIDQRWVLSWTK